MRFDQQVINSKNYVLPFIEKTGKLNLGAKVLEIGCGEGGVLKPFFDIGCECLGVDLDPPRIVLGNDFLKSEVQSGKLQLILKNILDNDFEENYSEYFDIIILKDVIEHIHGQENFIFYLKKLLKPKGRIFFLFSALFRDTL